MAAFFPLVYIRSRSPQRREACPGISGALNGLCILFSEHLVLARVSGGGQEILRKEGVAVEGAAPWLRVIHSRPNAESGRHWSAFSTPSHTSHSCGRGRVVHSAASLPSWRLLSPPAFQNLCFLDKGSFHVWHSIQNPWDPQQEEQAAALGTWRHPGLVLVLGAPCL